MLSRFFYILFTGQVIGAIGTWYYTRRLEPSEASRIRRKFIAYFLITAAVPLVLISRPAFLAFTVALLIVGCVEMWMIGRSRLLRSQTLPVYAVIGAGFAVFAVRADVATIIGVYGLIIGLDGFSQLAGQLFGKHALAPRISPGKTIEGFLGGAALSLLTYSALRNFDMPRAALETSGIILCAGLLGDLIASSYKRRVGVKDFGSTIPYHGGVLDRFDSFIFAGSIYAVISLVGFTL
jgi:phosphatidate cytidylyltransferase